MQIQIAIIDDIEADAVAYRDLVARRMAEKSGRFPDLDAELQFTVEAIYPHALEDGGDFLERVERYLRCEAPFERYRTLTKQKPTSLDELEIVDSITSESLHVVILDHYLMPGSRAGTERRTGIDIANFVRRYRPNIQRLLLSSEDDTGWTEAPENTVEAFFNKNSLLTENGQIRLKQTIRARLQDRLRAPYWKGLQAYSGMPKIVMHAMAITDAGSLAEAGTANEFLQHFGSDMFVAEASLILDPLDSVFAPQGSLKESLALYASTFAGEAIGAKCLFVTNGTSTSNKIVTEAVTIEGDIVLLDRNCHISHHFAYANQGLNPIWLEPLHDDVNDVSGAVDPSELTNSLNRLLAAGQRRGSIKLPAMITITNCSFDGFVVDPIEIIQATIEEYERFGVLERLGETAFLFDEAWFGFARFHPATTKYTASNAMRHYHLDKYLRDKVRIYATTSVHKTMSALRQASSIIAADSRYRGEHSSLGARFAQAYSNHTTTSPHAAMISSIDIARRQIDLEGTALLDRAIRSAKRFQDSVQSSGAKGDTLSRYFRVAKLDQSLENASRDPSKVLLQVPSAIGGAKMKKILWEKGRVQINKFSRNTVLFMFMIGFDDERVERLVEALRRVARQLEAEGISGGDFDASGALGSPPSFAAFLGTKGLSIGSTIEDAYLNGNDFVGRSVMRGALSSHVEHATLNQLRADGATFVAAGFVTPYPPGYPILVPGQVIDSATIAYLSALDNPEVHGTTIGPDGSRMLPVLRTDK